QPGRSHLDRSLAGQCRFTDGAELGQIEHVILAQPLSPTRKAGAKALQHPPTGDQLNLVTLAVSESDGLHVIVAGEGPRETRRRILPPGEQDQRPHCPTSSGRRTASASGWQGRSRRGSER